MSSNRNRKGINPIVIILALALTFVGGYMSIPDGTTTNLPDGDGDGVPDQYDAVKDDPNITDPVPPDELDPEDPYYDENYDVAPYVPEYPKSTDPRSVFSGNIFGGGDSLSLGNMILFIGIALLFVGLFIGRK